MNFLKKLFETKPKIKRIDLTRRFNLITRVGQGSMSKVWRATDTMTGRTVALKVLDKAKTEKLEARFAGLEKPSEGEIAVGLRHPNIVQTYEHGLTLKREQFLVMEFVEGKGLSFLVETQSGLMKDQKPDLMIQLAQGIEYFHKVNWIHRDICPRNVLVSDEGILKLIDFGLVVPNTPPFQKPGNRTGTANYMAPELIKRQKTDQRIDIFSYAVTCYEMWTQRMPWDGGKGGSLESALQHINTPPDDIREHCDRIPDKIADTIMRGLALNPRDRWPSMSKIIAELEAAKADLS